MTLGIVGYAVGIARDQSLLSCLHQLVKKFASTHVELFLTNITHIDLLTLHPFLLGAYLLAMEQCADV